MNIRTKIVLTTSAAIVMFGAASAAVAHRSGDKDKGERHSRGEMMFEMLDADKDGKVTRAEAEGFRDQKLVEFDVDKDGALNQAEYTAMVNAMMADHIKRRFERQDADKDGKLDKTEVAGRMAKMFDWMDTNDDGAIDRDEMDKHRRHHGGRHGDGKDHDKS